MKKNREKIALKKNDRSNNITATVTFGMPAKDCSYNGICRIEPENHYVQDTDKCSGLAKIFYNENDQLLFEFNKKDLHRRTIEKHFGSNYFIVIEDYKAPDFFCEAFGKRTMIILQGIYKIQVEKDFYKVSFNTMYP